MNINCILCGELGAKLQETINVSDLNRAYERNLGIPSALTTRSLDYYKCLECDLGFFGLLNQVGRVYTKACNCSTGIT